MDTGQRAGSVTKNYKSQICLDTKLQICMLLLLIPCFAGWTGRNVIWWFVTYFPCIKLSARIKGAPRNNLSQCTCINHFFYFYLFIYLFLLPACERIVMWHERRDLPVSLGYRYKPADDLIKVAIYKRPHVVFVLPKNSGQHIHRVTMNSG